MKKEIVLFTILSIVASALIITSIVVGVQKKQQEHQERQQIMDALNQLEIEQHEVVEVAESKPYYPIEFYVNGMFNDEYTMAEVVEIASTVCVEARGGSDKLQRAVASVIINRKNHPRYPNTIHGVIHQHGQYQGAITGTMQKYVDIYNGDDVSDEEFLMYERVLENVEYVLECGTTIPESVVYQSGFVQGSGVYDKIDDEIFCYE